MPSEVQRIPPAPRRVLWRRVLGYRWPLAAATFALSLYGGVITWLFFLANSPRLETARRLDRGPTTKLEATIEHVEPIDGAQLVRYGFRAADQDYTGNARIPGGQYEAGAALAIEYLDGEPAKNRPVGVPPQLRAQWFDPGDSFAVLVVPGLLLGVAWLAGVLHLRRVLAHGDVGIAQVLEVRAVRFCLPENYSVRFRFRDHHARERTARHWVRAHSPLGQRLLTMLRHESYDKVPVLHDRRFPQHCRLVLPEDFRPQPGGVDPAATIRL